MDKPKEEVKEMTPEEVEQAIADEFGMTPVQLEKARNSYRRKHGEDI